MARKKRIYKKGVPGSEYDAYTGKPEQIKRRAQRNKARRAAEKRLGKAALRGKEVDHVGSHRTGSLANVPTRVVSKKTNRKRQPKREG